MQNPARCRARSFIFNGPFDGLQPSQTGQGKETNERRKGEGSKRSVAGQILGDAVLVALSRPSTPLRAFFPRRALFRTEHEGIFNSSVIVARPTRGNQQGCCVQMLPDTRQPDRQAARHTGFCEPSIPWDESAFFLTS